MTAEHVFHRSTGRAPTRCRSRGRHLPCSMLMGAGTSTLAAGRPFPALAMAIPRSSPPSSSRRSASNSSTPASSRRDAAEELATLMAEMSPGSARPGLVHRQRLGSDRGGAEARAAISSRTRRHGPKPGHCSAPELSRQYARCARGRRKRVAARTVRAAADRRRAHRSLLRISLRRTGRELRRTMAEEQLESLEQEIVRLGPETIIAFVAETVVGATAGAVPPVARLFQARARDLRSSWRPADPRRSDVRIGQDRHVPVVRAGRRSFPTS